MRWEKGRRSGNVVDARGRGSPMSFGRGGGLSLGGIAVVVVLSLVTGQNPLALLGMLEQASGPTAEQGVAPPENDESVNFVRSILGETEDVWSALFSQSGQAYPAPKLVVFRGSVQSGCGGASAATGPFYCPLDRNVYLDLSFFEEMNARLGGGGDFAYAYVIAHEVGHHVQTVTGVTDRVQRARAQGQNVSGASGPLVRQELQADCLAGVWAHHAQQRLQWLEAGDIEEAMNTASAIGDDRLQRQQQGQVVPDAFTHGTSAQRVRWFRQGFDSGDTARCDTFSGALKG